MQKSWQILSVQLYEISSGKHTHLSCPGTPNKTVVLKGGILAPIPGDHCQCLETFLLVTMAGVGICSRRLAG